MTLDALQQTILDWFKAEYEAGTANILRIRMATVVGEVDVMILPPKYLLERVGVPITSLGNCIEGTPDSK